MSVFQVVLNSATPVTENSYSPGGTFTYIPGQLDINAYTGLQNIPSKQRTIYVMGPDRINRELHDGDTFTDCNYWKKFDFIQVITDDGSVWNDSTHSSSNIVASATLTGTAGTTYTDTGNRFDINKTYGTYAVYTRLENLGASGSVTIRLNYSSAYAGATFTLDAGHTMHFDVGDLSITKIEVSNNDSGAVTSPVQVLCLVLSPVNS